VKSGGYPLYDVEAGEAEKPYTTAYFAVLVEVILSRSRTSEFSHDQNRPSAESDQGSDQAKSLEKDSLKSLEDK
jgi:hypothetical protein